MALPIVVALIPLFYFVTRDTSRYYLGRYLWVGFFAVYGIIVHLVRKPWNTILEDFKCSGNTTDFCVTDCFEKFFQFPVTGIWCYFFFVCLGLFLLFEFLMSKFRRKKKEEKLVQSVNEETGSMVPTQEHPPFAKFSSLNFHDDKIPLFSYLLYFLLLIVAQCLLLYFLLYQHLPLTSQPTIRCSTDYCPGPSRCLIKWAAEKQLSIYILISFSFTTILFTLGFFLYVICHYLLPLIGVLKRG